MNGIKFENLHSQDIKIDMHARLHGTNDIDKRNKNTSQKIQQLQKQQQRQNTLIHKITEGNCVEEEKIMK